MTPPADENQPPSIYLPEDSPYVGGNLLHNLLLFGRICRVLGMAVNPNRMVEVARALEHIDLGRKTDVYHALRALMVNHRRDFPLFDEAFDIFWRRPSDNWSTLDLQSLGERRRQKKTQFLPPAGASPEDPNADENSKPAVDPQLLALVPTYSTSEALRHKDFAEMTADELAQAQYLMTQLPRSVAYRRSRRYQLGKGPHLALRHTLRKNLRYGGEMVQLPTRRFKTRPRPIVLICDISGSMERYTRLLMQFMHLLAQGMYQIESFVFATRLTRITRNLRHKTVDVALKEVGLTVKDWGGGTKTGEALHTFNYQWARRVLGRGAVVMLMTDGWDRGDPDQLHDEIARLQRNCYRLIWLNPLLGSAEYAPLTRGAQTMLPFVDDFLPIHNLASLENLITALGKIESHRNLRGHRAIDVSQLW